ncbi:hypothetical protein GBA52_016879 [Prunus armeniaca]|nr:hypothetical protein GBA52_016879 [Prunus armeniaca]
MALDTHGQQQNLIKPPHVAIVPTPGIGHLTPLVELAKLLVVHHNFTITFIIPNDGSHLAPQKKLLEALDPQAISYIFLPPVSFDDLPDDVMVETKIALTLTRSLPALHDSLKVLTESTRLVALLVDLFGADTSDVANELHVPLYIFFTTSALSLSLIFHFPHLHETTTCEYRDLPELVQLPGCVPLHGRDFMDPVQDRSNEAYKVMVRMCKKYKSAAGIMVNSFVDLEPGAFKAFKEQGQGLPPVYPVGPVALGVKLNDKGIVESQDIAKYVRGLIEGDEGKLLRNKMKGYKEAAKLALSQEGSSTKSLAEVARVWKGLKI